MPYERRGKCVFNKKTGKKMGCSSSTSKAESYLKALYANVKENSQFDKKLLESMENLGVVETIEEAHYAKWLDQKGRKVYPGLLSIKNMKKVLGKKLGYFQKRGKIYSLPLIPTKGKIQKEFKKYYKRTFLPRPFA